MIGIFQDSGARLAITYNGLDLNNPADAVDDTFEVNLVTVGSVSDTRMENRPLEDGSEVYDARRQWLIIRIDGTIRAPTLAKLFDKAQTLSGAFDPSKVSHEDTTGRNGFLPLYVQVPTTNTTDYATGLYTCFYYARARVTPTPRVSSQYEGFAAFFTVELMVADPRRYYNTQETQVGAGTINNKGNCRTWPTLTITMSDAGSATYTIENNPALSGQPTEQLVLDLSGRSAAQVVVVDFERRKITVDGVETPSLYVSGDFWDLEPGNNVIAITNGTNATSSTAWRRAWVY